MLPSTMRPLRVLHVTPYFGDAWAYGGIPRVVGALALGQAARGDAVTVCTTDACTESTRLAGPPNRQPLRPWAAAATAPGLVVRVFPNVSNRLAYRQLFVPVGLRRYLAHSAPAFDVAHLHACRNLPGVIAAGALRRAGIPYVLAPNGTAPRIERRRLAKRLFDAVAGSRVLRDAARLIAVSQAERDQLRSVGVGAEEIRIIPNPISVEEFEPPPVRGGFRRTIAAGARPLVLFLGQISPRKRVDVLVRAFALLSRPDARLVIAGNDAGAARPARRLAQTLGIGGQVIFPGLLRGQERLAALADADIVVYPSQDEVFGLVPVEALLCGTPVAVAGDCGCAEVVGSMGGGHVVPLGDHVALARAIETTLRRPRRWRAAADAAAARIRATYARDRVCAQMDAVYRELV